MDLRKLRHAHILAIEGNFARAARSLHLTQPALSRSIKSLEAELGLSLFDRLPEGTRPTAAGKHILKLADGLLRSAKGIENEARLLREGEAGKLTFGVGPMITPFLRNALPDFYADNKQVNLEIIIEPIGRMLELLLADEIEFFISVTSAIPPNSDIEISEISTTKVGYFAQANHPLLSPKKDEYNIEDFLLATPRLANSSQLPKTPELATLSCRAYVQCDNIDVMKNLAMTRDAILLALGPALEPELSQGKFKQLPVDSRAGDNATIGLVKLSNRSLSPAAKKLIQSLKEENLLSGPK